MVNWLSPTELARAGVKAVLAATFGNYADKREVQAALSPGLNGATCDYSDAPELWIDYVADLGDGFNSTYALAWLLAQPALEVARPSGQAVRLPRGQALVLGGDQVYPTATRGEYRRRFTGPYAVAFGARPRQRTPHTTDLFALPGNHDWYDGLTSFTRVFCRPRALGSLRTRQQRSYFALRLPHDWWLWGIDIQLNAYIDQPQMDFFVRLAAHTKAAATARAPRVILCTAEPTWVHCGNGTRARDTLRDAPAKHSTLAYFEQHAIREQGLELALVLSGDLHHYTHYAPTNGGVERITSGGGGAYLYPTHHMPPKLAVDGSHAQPTHKLAKTYPPPERSRRLGWGVLALPLRNVSFAGLLGALYLCFAWLVQSASKSTNDVFGPLAGRLSTLDPPLPASPSLMEVIARLPVERFADVTSAFWHVMRHSPASVVFVLAVVAGLWKYRAADDETAGEVFGLLHGAAHVALNFGLMWLFAALNLDLLHWKVDEARQVFLFTGEMLVLGALAGGALFAAYLLLSARLTGVHVNDVYASQSLPDDKSFLRLHVRHDGRLEVFPVGVPRVPRDDGWRVNGADDGAARLSPAAGHIPTELIEESIVVG